VIDASLLAEFFRNKSVKAGATEISPSPGTFP